MSRNIDFGSIFPMIEERHNHIFLNWVIPSAARPGPINSMVTCYI